MANVELPVIYEVDEESSGSKSENLAVNSQGDFLAKKEKRSHNSRISEFEMSDVVASVVDAISSSVDQSPGVNEASVSDKSYESSKTNLDNGPSLDDIEEDLVRRSDTDLTSLKSSSSVFSADTDMNDSERSEMDDMFGEDLKSSPMRGKSVKEFNEQLANLQKENFSLKLRIYFLEERMGSLYRPGDIQNVVKKNIEYKVEIEELRRELEEKQDLLCQAVKAMQLEEEEHKKEMAKKDIEIADLSDKINSIQSELDAMLASNETLEKQRSLDEEKNQSANQVHIEIEQLNSHIEDLKQQLALERKQSRETLDQLNDFECIEVRCKNLEKEITEKDSKIKLLIAKVEEKNHMVSSYNLRIRAVEDVLNSQKNDLEYKDSEIEQRSRTLENQITEIRELNRTLEEYQKELRQMENLKNCVMQRDNAISDLESKLAKCKSVIKNLEAKLDTIAHENKRNQEELETMKEQRKRSSGINDYQSPNVSPRSLSTRSLECACRHENCDAVKLLKVQLDEKNVEYMKALSIVRGFVIQTKALEAKEVQLQNELEKKSKQLEDLQTKDMQKTIESKFTGHFPLSTIYKNSPTGLGTSNKENVLEDSHECRLTTDMEDQLELKKQIQSLMKTLEEKEMLLFELQNKYEISTMIVKEKDNRILALEEDIAMLKLELDQSNKQLEIETGQSCAAEEKDKKIERLENEVRKQTFNLQGIVNNELWDKNREIEKITNKFVERLKLKDEQLISVEKDWKNELQKSKEECEYLHKTIKELRQEICNMPERDIDCSQMKTIDKLRAHYEKSVKMYSLLTKRLEELALFLDSLLKHKSVLGLLSSKNHCDIKQVIDESLDLSKSIMNDESLAQLSSISGILNVTQASLNTSLFDMLDDNADNRANASLTYNSHLSKLKGDINAKNATVNQDEIINALRTQIESMKKEIELRDMELGKQVMNCHGSEQEKSLENDNELVDVIIDLHNKSSRKLKTSEILSPGRIYKNLITDNNPDNMSESDAWSQPDLDVSQARIGLDALKSPPSRSNLNKSVSVDDSSLSTEEDSPDNEVSKRESLENRHNVASPMQIHIITLETKLKEKENEILALQCSHFDMDNKSKTDKINMCEQIEKLKNEKMEIENTWKEAEEKMKMRDEIFTQTEVHVSKLKDMIKTLQTKELEYTQKLQSAELKWLKTIKVTEQNAEIKIIEMHEIVNSLKKNYEENYIEKSQMSQHFEQMKIVCSDLESFKELLKNSDSKVKVMEDTEKEIKNQMLEAEKISREKIMTLKKELNETTLRASQAVLDRTKACNEKLKVEQELRKLELKDQEKTKMLNEKEKQLTYLHKNIVHNESQKGALQLKLSELETTNAELHNRLVKLQSGNTEQIWSKSEPSSPIKIAEVYVRNLGKHSMGSRFLRQRSDMSGYVSEDHMTDDYEGVLNRSAPEGCQWFNNIVPVEADARNVVNSSPDLGIESDQGRFSSLETNVATRPLLQTLELTASMNNLLSNDKRDNPAHFCNIINHRVLERENADLQRAIAKLEVNLQKTCKKLSLINQNKKQVEKAVCKQIHQTSIVLRQARANLDSGSENENRK